MTRAERRGLRGGADCRDLEPEHTLGDAGPGEGGVAIGLPRQPVGRPDQPLVDDGRRRPAHDPAVGRDDLAGGDHDQVARPESFERDVDLGARRAKPGEPPVLCHAREQPAAGPQQPIAVRPAPELERPAHQGGGQELAGGEGRNNDGRVEDGQAELALPDLVPGHTERLHVGSDQEQASHGEEGRQGEFSRRGQADRRVCQPEPDRGRVSRVSHRQHRPLQDRVEDLQELARLDRGRVEMDQQGRRPRPDPAILNPVDRGQLMRDPVADLSIGPQRLVPETNPPG